MGAELTHTQAVNRLEEIQDELSRLSEKDTLTPEDETYWGELNDEFRTVDAHRKRLERAADLAQIRSVQVGKVRDAARRGHTENGGRPSLGDFDRDVILEPDSIDEARFRNPWDLSEMRGGLSPDARGRELKARAKSAIEKMSGSNDKIRQGATKIIEQFDDARGRIAELALVTSSPEYLRAFGKLLRSHGSTATLEADEQAAFARAMSLTDSAGGFLVPFQLDPSVIITSDGSYNEIRQAARQVIATSDTWNGVSAGATSWSFDAEAAEVSDDSSTFAQPSIPIHTARGFVPISLEAAQDEINVANEVARLLAQGKDDLEAVKFAVGTGSGEPTGIVTALVASSPSSIVSAGTDGTFALADVYSTYNGVAARYRQRGSWLANNLTYDLIRQMGSNEANMWPQTLVPGQPQTLLGRPKYEAEAMDSVIDGAAHNYMLIFGDLSNYVVADRIGMTIEYIPQLFSTSNGRPTGQRGWFAHYRVGADSVNDNGMALLDI